MTSSKNDYQLEAHWASLGTGIHYRAACLALARVTPSLAVIPAPLGRWVLLELPLGALGRPVEGRFRGPGVGPRSMRPD
ncbi:MAG TPA: hypothetical protein VMU49_07935 [Candidatus Acidoferrales bacterium]|nr:hypothetical protein [Candidatus Acidoferrales bacterium]